MKMYCKSVTAIVSCMASFAMAATPSTQEQKRTAAILTPPAPAMPRINGPRTYGERTGKPFLYKIPATGDAPITFAAEDLPAGLTLDASTGLITGRCNDAGTHAVKVTATSPRGSASVTLQIVIGDTICLTPPLGWNSWNKFATNVTDADVRGAADAMVASGLINHGWTYINIDDAWENKPDSQDPLLSGPLRDEKGNVLSNKKFPDMKALSDYIHSKGLKFGIYSSPGPTTCAGYTATYQHEDQDAQTYADWGVDYVKYDWCSYSNIARQITTDEYAKLVPPEDVDKMKSLTDDVARLSQRRGRRSATATTAQSELGAKRAELNAIYAKMDPDKKKAVDLEILQHPYRQFTASLAKTGRDIVFSFCQYGTGDVWKWGADAGGNSWRTTGDIRADWRSIANIGFNQNGHEAFAGPGHWNDPDMLEVGNGPLTPDEMYTHMSLWSMLASPLLIGCDMTKMDALTTSMFSNDEVLAVSQDSLGKQGFRVKQEGLTQVWMKPMADGTVAVGLFNLDASPQKIDVAWSDLKMQGSQPVRDLWRETDLGNQDTGWSTTVASHGVALIRVGTAK